MCNQFFPWPKKKRYIGNTNFFALHFRFNKSYHYYSIIGFMKHVDNKDELTELAKRIRSARSNAHLSQHTLGKSIGLSDKAISAYEKGRSQPPLENLRKIADATHYPLTYFTQEENVDVEITAKLLSIERELAEVKRLLKKAK